MAREIHDTLGHYLTILAVKLETATKMEERGDTRLHEELSEARRVASECLVEVRHSVAALRPAGLNEESFETALRNLVHEFLMSDPEVEVDIRSRRLRTAIATEYRLALFRATQEALTNIRKHAHATKVLLRLRLNEDIVEFTVLDNGVGSGGAGQCVEKGFGLLGMRERVALLGGTIAAGPEPSAAGGWRSSCRWRVKVRVKCLQDHCFHFRPQRSGDWYEYSHASPYACSSSMIKLCCAKAFNVSWNLRARASSSSRPPPMGSMHWQQSNVWRPKVPVRCRIDGYPDAAT